MSTQSLVKKLKESEQDFEWYPTTKEILRVIKSDIDNMVNTLQMDECPSILDCGAGDGRSLMYLTKGKKYAIEKARILIERMDRSIFTIGADFDQQTLIDKEVDIVFSNPPYKSFVQWAVKIIKESRSGYVYLVIPQRWEKDLTIQQALELRNATYEVIGTFDFTEADRQARAVCHIVKVKLTTRSHKYFGKSESETDPFDLWFNENFKIDTRSNSYGSWEPRVDKTEVKQSLVEGKDVVQTLTALYDRDMGRLLKNFKDLETFDRSILEELGVSFEGLRESLKKKISSLKNVYWRELFSNLEKITERLTKKSREKMLELLTSRTDVGFNSDNVYAVVIWVIKNANHYFDDQLIDLVENMVDKGNIKLYKSNQRTFGDDEWRYWRKPEDLDKFSLDYRVVLENIGGICNSEWEHERRVFNGLSERPYHFLQDILTVATNIGFDTTDMVTPMDFEWESNKSCDFYYYDHSRGEEVILMSVKAFKNNNLHIKFAPRFIMRLNVEFGRLKGWLKSAQQATEEMDIDAEEAAECFNSNIELGGSNLIKIAFVEAA